MGKAEGPEIIDVHCHCFAGSGQAEKVTSGLARLRRAGVRHLAVMGLGNTRLDVDEINRLIPEGFPNFGDPLFNEIDLLLQFTLGSFYGHQVVAAYLDAYTCREVNG